MKPYILIRDLNDDYKEKAALEKLGIPYATCRSEVPAKTTVIGRYSVLPFYSELAQDLSTKGSELINSNAQFQYCADMQNWYQDLKDETPYTWFRMEDYIRDNHEGPVVLKGATNSRRDRWLTHMYAKDKDAARKVYCNLQDDGLISSQQIYIRKYEPLLKLTDGVSGMPIPNEWRYFVFKKQVVAAGYYWSTYLDDISISFPKPNPGYMCNLISKVGLNSNFYSMDVAQKANKEWTLIELNEGQMSGLNSIDPTDFYKRLTTIMGAE